MVETAGEVVVVPTAGGKVEAQRMGGAEAGLSRWCVRHTWSQETFFGNSGELVGHVQRRVAEAVARSAKDLQ
jgi:hypothetical protein